MLCVYRVWEAPAVAPRSNWKGYLKLSLVSASIAIYPATSATEKVRFNTLNRATGNRLKRQMLDSVTGEPVESDEQVKGYAVANGRYVIVEDDELSNIAIESSRTVDIENFVPKTSIDDRYRDTPNYLAPEDKVGQEAFAVIRDAMKKNKMARQATGPAGGLIFVAVLLGIRSGPIPPAGSSELTIRLPPLCGRPCGGAAHSIR
jgi:non-homologous end joining protein Ku